MRIKLALVTGAAVLLTAGTGAAAYAVVGQETVSPTITGNDLPIDDNHSPTVTARTTEPGDDRGTAVAPGDDRGTTAEPGDDRGGAEPGDDRGGFEPGDDRSTGVDDGARHGGSTGTTAPATADDHGGSGGSGGSGSGHGGHGGDDGSGHH